LERLNLPPLAPVLLESMRAIGYSPATAIADLVDNSITAQASTVDVRFPPGRPSAIGILDDGTGMSHADLLEAMRHGSRSPTEHRVATDLGRFGLGLKTASLSQCRRLTVVTRKLGHTAALVWDLEEVKRSENWTVGVLGPGEIENVPFVHELGRSGTLVVWEDLDRIAAGDLGDGAVVGARMREVSDHLSLVFHRFLAGSRPELVIRINGRPLPAFDPFLETEGSEHGPEETIRVDGENVTLQAFTLPHISRLTRAQIDKAGGEHGLRRQQGFYIYRSKRLLTWGTWFRLFKQEELTKLTRVRVDIPNSLDHFWSLDIKKSSASPPAAIRERLKGLVPTMVRSSRQANQYRGTVNVRKGIRPVWLRVEDRDGIRYEIDRNHPVIAALRASLDDGVQGDLDSVLAAISMSLPVEGLYNDRANDRMGHRREGPEPQVAADTLELLARQVLEAFASHPQEQRRKLEELSVMEPFALFPDITQKLRERLAP
jgi:hypothetical protein